MVSRISLRLFCCVTSIPVFVVLVSFVKSVSISSQWPSVGRRVGDQLEGCLHRDIKQLVMQRNPSGIVWTRLCPFEKLLIHIFFQQSVLMSLCNEPSQMRKNYEEAKRVHTDLFVGGFEHR